MILLPVRRQHQLVPQVCVFVRVFDLGLCDLSLRSRLLFFLCYKLVTLILPPDVEL